MPSALRGLGKKQTTKVHTHADTLDSTARQTDHSRSFGCRSLVVPMIIEGKERNHECNSINAVAVKLTTLCWFIRFSVIRHRVRERAKATADDGMKQCSIDQM